MVINGLWPRYVDVRGNTAYDRGLFKSARASIKPDGTIVRNGLFRAKVGRYANGQLEYGWIIKNRSGNFANGEVKMRTGLFSKVYYYSPACSEEQAAVGVVAHILLDEAAAAQQAMQNR